MTKVLIIDDDERMATYLVKFLKLKGYDVEIAMTGEDGIRAFRERRPQIVVLDIGLPDIDGRDVFPRLKEIDGNIPIGILSGYKDFKEEMLAKGVTAYFVKPLLPPELIEWIDSIITK